ncbi:MAG: hypothetical protein IKQ69_07860 [Oscillospiraceae bacterium]|nr:hypothetical protein [Oscillospiraceae bacterium]
MNEKQFKETMARYLEEHGIWSEIIPVVMETADRVPGGLLELAYYVLDQGQGLTQSGLVEMALHIGKGGDAA